MSFTGAHHQGDIQTFWKVDVSFKTSFIRLNHIFLAIV